MTAYRRVPLRLAHITDRLGLSRRLLDLILAEEPSRQDLPEASVGRLLREHLDTLSNDAQQFGIDFDVILRNSVADSPRPFVDDQKLVLHYATGRHGASASLADAAAYVGRPNGPAGLLLDWLQTGEAAELRLSDASPVLSVYLSIRAALRATGAHTPVDIEGVARALAHLDGNVPPELKPHFKRLDSVQRLTVRAFRRLPVRSQQVLFADKTVSDWLPPSVERRVIEDPFAYPSTPASIARQSSIEKGRLLAESGQLEGLEVTEFLTHSANRRLISQTLRTTLACRTVVASTEVKSLLQDRWPGREASAVILRSMAAGDDLENVPKPPNSMFGHLHDYLPGITAIVEAANAVDAAVLAAIHPAALPELVAGLVEREVDIPASLAPTFWAVYGRRIAPNPNKTRRRVSITLCGQSDEARWRLVSAPAFLHYAAGARPRHVVTLLRQAKPGAEMAGWAMLVARLCQKQPRTCLLYAERHADPYVLSIVLNHANAAFVARILRPRRPIGDREAQLWASWFRQPACWQAASDSLLRRVVSHKAIRHVALKTLELAQSDELIRRWGMPRACRAAVSDPLLSHRIMEVTTPPERLTLSREVRLGSGRKKRQDPAAELCALFGWSYYRRLQLWLGRVAARPSLDRLGCAFDGEYRHYLLPKRSGGSRRITVPSDTLKSFQRSVLRYGLESLPLHEAAKGFRKTESIVSNATPHCRHEVVVNVDIRNFFPSTSYKRVRAVVGTIYGGQISSFGQRALTELLCFDGGLPMGAPTSPAISNLVLRPVDRALATVCKRYEITYTRYADDLTFSGDSSVTRILPFVVEILRKLGYELDPKKTNIYRRGRRQLVTGLVVNDRPNVPRRLRRRIRAAIHRRACGQTPEWHGRPITDDQLRGHLAFLAQTQPEEAVRLKARWRSATDADG